MQHENIWDQFRWLTWLCSVQAIFNLSQGCLGLEASTGLMQPGRGTGQRANLGSWKASANAFSANSHEFTPLPGSWSELMLGACLRHEIRVVILLLLFGG